MKIKSALYKIVVRIRRNRKMCWYLSMIGKYTLVLLSFVLVFQIGSRVGQKKALASYEQWLEEYKADQEAAAMKAIEEDPYTIQLNAEAEMLAKVCTE